MSTLVAALTAIAAITAVYFFCLRPMRRARCGIVGPQRDAELDRQIADLREELRTLRAQDSLHSGQVPIKRPSPNDA
jgi:hypothetical protein